MSGRIRTESLIPSYFFDQLRGVDSRLSRWNRCSFDGSKAIASVAVANQRTADHSPKDFVIFDTELQPIADNERCFTIDPIAITARKNVDIALRFFRKKLERNAIDGQGSTVKVYIDWKTDDCPRPTARAVVTEEKSYINAHWCGNNSAVFGIGDANYFGNFVNDIDTVGHEFGHGVIEHTAQLEYLNESGALNESICDAIGSMLKQYSLDQKPYEADWLIGDNIVRDLQNQRMSLRSMKNPGTAYDFGGDNKDLQVAHMVNYKKLPMTLKGDWGGVHINSGIPNKAFFVFAAGFNHYSWEVAGQVWMKALYQSKSTTDF